MAEAHGVAVVRALHALLDAHEGIHASHRKRVTERAALPPVVREAAVTVTREALGEIGGQKRAG